MTTYEEIRTAIAEACGTIPGWHAHPYGLDSVAPPQIQVWRGPIRYNAVFGGEAHDYRFTLTAYVLRDSFEAAQKRLQNLCDPTSTTSLKAVLEADTYLLSLVHFVVVSDASEDKSVTVGAIEYVTVDFEVEVGA